jgi:mannonate dehydratase
MGFNAAGGNLWTSPPWEPLGEPVVRIREVRAICTAPEGIRLVVVKVETTEPGLYGLGCATFTQRPLAVVAAVERYLKPFLIGRSVDDIEDIWQAAYLSSYWRNSPVLHNALSGVDMALWDIKGKRAGMPLYQLLGGRCRVALPLYAHAAGRDFQEVEEQVCEFATRGYRFIRCQVAVPGRSTYGVKGDLSERRDWDPRAYCRIIPRLFDYLRSRVGEEVELLHDVHERVPPIDAIQLAKALEPYRLFFLEDPVSPEDAEYLRLLRSQCATPIALGELFVNPAEYVPLVRERLLDFIRVHLSAIGGLTPARKLAALCEFFGVRTAFHGPGDVSPVGHAANLHLGLAIPNFGIQEQHEFTETAREVFPGTPEIRDGMLWPNDRPGLGVDLNEQLAAKYSFPDHVLEGSWPPLRGVDGTVLRP